MNISTKLEKSIQDAKKNYTNTKVLENATKILESIDFFQNEKFRLIENIMIEYKACTINENLVFSEETKKLLKEGVIDYRDLEKILKERKILSDKKQQLVLYRINELDDLYSSQIETLYSSAVNIINNVTGQKLCTTMN